MDPDESRRLAESVGQTTFSKLQRAPTLANKVADLLLQSIVSRQLRVGDELPSERVLAEQFGVSRTVIREAVRSLAAKGVVEVHTGTRLRVIAVDASMVTESMALFLLGREQVDYTQVQEVRQMLETHLVKVATQRATSADLTELAAAHRRMVSVIDDPTQVALADVEFHRTIARITHNELYLILLDSIGDLLLEIRRATVSLPGRPQRAVEYHQTIVDRISSGDEAGAQEAMLAHLEESAVVWRDLAADAPTSKRATPAES